MLNGRSDSWLVCLRRLDSWSLWCWRFDVWFLWFPRLDGWFLWFGYLFSAFLWTVACWILGSMVWKFGFTVPGDLVFGLTVFLVFPRGWMVSIHPTFEWDFFIFDVLVDASMDVWYWNGCVLDRRFYGLGVLFDGFHGLAFGPCVIWTLHRVRRLGFGVIGVVFLD